MNFVDPPWQADIQNLLAWLAVEYKFVGEIKKEFTKVQKQLSLMKAGVSVPAKVMELLNGVGRAESQVQKYEKQVEHDLETHVRNHPEQDLENLREKLRVASVELIEKLSRYEGELRAHVLQLYNISYNIQRIEKSRNEELQAMKVLGQLKKKTEEQARQLEWVTARATEREQHLLEYREHFRAELEFILMKLNGLLEWITSLESLATDVKKRAA